MEEKVIKRYWPIFVIPTLAAFAIGFIWPFIQGIYLSFCSFTTIDKSKWVGFDNYLRALGLDKNFKDPSPLTDSLWFTVAFAVVSIVLINVIAFIFALVLTRGLKGTNIFRTIFFMPNLIGGVVLGYIWKVLINCVLLLVKEPLLALNSTAGFWGLIILMVWQQVGYMMIIYIAGLQSIPESLIEAAQIDGATSMQTLFKIKLPMVMSSITICVFLTLTNSFKLFDQNMALTNGDPANSTTMLALNIYKTFYDRIGASWKGLGQAKAVVFSILVIGISLIQLKATRSKEVQQ
ncbi:MAG: sugar ABC transporter permease [Lachnospiraceae bacterium]|jgi:raffinose/stachyose/melibiose transport system permease protein|nr:sugar ABC transporter permease [Lachnospiraceae bacterium]